MQWVEACERDALPLQGARLFRFQKEKIAIFRTVDDQVFAIESTCPHRGGPLEEGLVHGCRVTCPLHSRHFDLSTGKAVWPDKGRVTAYPVRVEGGLVFIGIGKGLYHA